MTPWNHERIAKVIGLLDELLAAADLPDADMDAFLTVLMPRLRTRSGLEAELFNTSVYAAVKQRAAQQTTQQTAVGSLH